MKLSAKLGLAAVMMASFTGIGAAANAQVQTFKRPTLVFPKKGVASAPKAAPAPKMRRLFHVACVGEGDYGFASATFKVEPLMNLNMMLGRRMLESNVGPLPIKIDPKNIRAMSAPVFRTSPAGKPQVCVTIDADVAEF